MGEQEGVSEGKTMCCPVGLLIHMHLILGRQDSLVLLDSSRVPADARGDAGTGL